MHLSTAVKSLSEFEIVRKYSMCQFLFLLSLISIQIYFKLRLCSWHMVSVQWTPGRWWWSEPAWWRRWTRSAAGSVTRTPWWQDASSRATTTAATAPSLPWAHLSWQSSAPSTASSPDMLTSCTPVCCASVPVPTTNQSNNQSKLSFVIQGLVNITSYFLLYKYATKDWNMKVVREKLQ